MENKKTYQLNKKKNFRFQYLYCMIALFGFMILCQSKSIYAKNEPILAQVNFNETKEEQTNYATRFGLNFQTELTDWQLYLYQNPNYAVVYGNLSNQFDANGNRIYSDAFIIGLLANISYEGSPGVVEQTFARFHHYGFYLPSGNEYVTNLNDISYLMNWPTDSKTKKGSCGVSSVQWSFGRRINWLNNLRTIVTLEGRTQCTTLDYMMADAKMFQTELATDGYYYHRVIKMAKANGGSAASYAEAICDFYESPGSADLNMSGTGSACKERRAMATQLWSIFSKHNSQIVPYVSQKK